MTTSTNPGTSGTRRAGKQLGLGLASLVLMATGAVVAAPPASASTIQATFGKYTQCRNVGGMGDENFSQGHYRCVFYRKTGKTSKWRKGPWCVKVRTTVKPKSRTVKRVPMRECPNV